MARLFGTDGIRGKANSELTPEIALKLGLALTNISDCEKVLVGRDTRESGQMLLDAVSAGVMSGGANVADLGIISTPALSYLSMIEKVPGIMVSASHNPFYDNGLKVFLPTGEKISNTEEERIASLIADGAQISSGYIGTRYDSRYLLETYENHLASLLPDGLGEFKIALDCANGAVYDLGPRIFSRLGSKVFSTNIDPDGQNINRDCGATKPETISKFTRESQADLGFSYDGDADRVVVATKSGAILDGDDILALLVKGMVEFERENVATIVGTVMTNIGLEKYLAGLGINLVRTAVGDRFICEEMKKIGAKLGGEPSGHIIHRDLNPTGDGLLISILVIKTLKNLGIDPANLDNLLITKYPQIIRSLPANNQVADLDGKINGKIEQIRSTIGDDVRIVIRKSGTEPSVRVMVEAREHEVANQLIEELCEFVAKEMSR